MKKTTRRSLALAAALSLIGITACGEDNADFPSESFELVVPYSAGGSSDTATRVLATEIEEISGETVVVVNRPGGGGAVALSEAANANNSGYEMTLAPGSAYATVPLLQDVSYTADDFKAVGGLYDQPYIILTSLESDIDSLEDLANQTDRVTYTTFAVGHVTHLSMANLFEEMGVEGEPVPYDSASESLQAVTSGQVDVGVIDMNIAAPQVESDAITPIAVNSAERHPAFPDIPAFGEEGYESAADYISRIAIAVPDDTPDEVADELSALLDEAMTSENYQQFLEESYLLEPAYAGPDFFTEYMVEEQQRAEADFERLGIN